MAASRHDLGAVYMAVHLLAPKQRREPVRIRGGQGQLLSPPAEFDAIFGHFKTVFSSQDRFQMPQHSVVQFGLEELKLILCP